MPFGEPCSYTAALPNEVVLACQATMQCRRNTAPLRSIPDLLPSLMIIISSQVPLIIASSEFCCPAFKHNCSRMEGLAAASAVFAVVSLAGQVAQGCTYLRGIFENARSAPKELQLLTTELMIIERIINGTPDIDQHEDELDFCNERLLKLRKLVDKYGELEGAGRGRKWGKRLAMAFGSDKLEKYLASLRQAKEYLERIQYL